MKVKFTCFSSQAKLCALILVGCFFPMTSTLAQSSSSTVREDLGGLRDIVWREPLDAASVIDAERSRYGSFLSAFWPSGIPSADQALFKAYIRLLNYVEQALQGGKALDDAIVESYEKVIGEAPADPELKEMPEGILFTYLPGLIEALTEVQQPQLSGQ